MPRISKDEKELCQLGWWLIERKVAYYKPEAVHTTRTNDYVVSDEEYDAAEERHLKLIRKLQLKNDKKPPYEGFVGPYPLNSVVHKGWPGFEDMLEPPNRPMMEIDDTRPSVQLVLKKLGSIK